MSENAQSPIFTLKDVYLSFAFLAQPDSRFNSTYRSSFVLHPDSRWHAENEAAVEAAIIAAAQEKWGPAWEKKMPPEDKWFIQEAAGEMFGGMLAVRARVYKGAPRLLLPQRDENGRFVELNVGDDGPPQHVAQAEKLFYSGARVHATLEAWAQDSPQYGRRINCGIRMVMFYKHGQRIGGPQPIDPESVFDDNDLPDDTEDFMEEAGNLGSAFADDYADDSAPAEEPPTRQPARKGSPLSRLRRG